MKSLNDFLSEANRAISQATGENKIIVFLEWRYRKLSLAFPHKTFSVSQATLDFFTQSLLYLDTKIPPKHDEKNNKKSEYDLNYIEWLEKNK